MWTSWTPATRYAGIGTLSFIVMHSHGTGTVVRYMGNTWVFYKSKILFRFFKFTNVRPLRLCFTIKRLIRMRIPGSRSRFWWSKILKKSYVFLIKKLQFTCTKDVQATGVAFGPQKRISSTPELEISFLFYFCGSLLSSWIRIRIQRPKSMRIRIQNTRHIASHCFLT